MTEPKTDKDPVEIISLEGKKLIKMFQGVLKNEDQKDRRTDIRRFYQQLTELLNRPGQENLVNYSDEELEKNSPRRGARTNRWSVDWYRYERGKNYFY